MLREFDEDTIVAISTPPGQGGLGVIRVSGSGAIPIVEKIFKSVSGKKISRQKSFTARYGHIVSCDDKKVLDEVLVLLMRSPKSYTTEDVIEISAHGGTAVLQAILEQILKQGARLASPGEFTKRAFLNGRMDLVQAEAVLDLISAKSELSRQWAQERLEGELSKRIVKVKDALLSILSQLEAAIDFPDDFLQPDSFMRVQNKVNKLQEQIQKILSSAQLGMIAKSGLKVVIAGRPNVGKSSLMNRLVRMNRVIVTPYPGTTRDVVEDQTQIAGFPVRFFDTAGIRDVSHPIEKEGIAKSKLMAEQAELLLCVFDGSQSLESADEELIGLAKNRKKIIVINKSDLTQKLDRQKLQKLLMQDSLIESSCLEEAGIQSLEDEITHFITDGKMERSDEPVVGSVRQKDLLEKVVAHLEEAKKACQENPSPELVAVDVRAALEDIGVLVGEVYTDDLLEVLFSQFCIGK